VLRTWFHILSPLQFLSEAVFLAAVKYFNKRIELNYYLLQVYPYSAPVKSTKAGLAPAADNMLMRAVFAITGDVSMGTVLNSQYFGRRDGLLECSVRFMIT
jgi:hypothetical protein